MQAHTQQVNHAPPRSRGLSRQSVSLTLGTAFVKFRCKMQPARIYLEFDISDMIFMGLILLAVLFVITWLVYLQEQIDWWFNDL